MTSLEWHGCPSCHLHAGVGLQVDDPYAAAKCPRCGWEGRVWQTEGRSEEARILRRMTMDNLRASRFQKVWSRSYDMRPTLNSVLASVCRANLRTHASIFIRDFLENN